MTLSAYQSATLGSTGVTIGSPLMVMIGVHLRHLGAEKEDLGGVADPHQHDDRRAGRASTLTTPVEPM